MAGWVACRSDRCSGTLIGVGVGPGNPQFMTLAAVHALDLCPVIAAPVTSRGHMAALDIAAQAVDLSNKTILPLDFAMTPAKACDDYDRAARSIIDQLACGLDVAMLSLGDVSLYSTFSRVAELVCAAGYPVQAIPGISTPSAIGAALGRALAGDATTPVHVVVARDERLREHVALPGTVVIMKAGGLLRSIREALVQAGRLDSATIVCDLGMPTERVYARFDEAPPACGYFTTVVVWA